MGRNNPETHRKWMRDHRPPSPFHDRVRNGRIERKCRKALVCGGEWALITEFVRHGNSKHGRLYTCKCCHHAYRRERWARISLEQGWKQARKCA